MTTLVDRFGRVHRDLGLCVTDRYAMRCTYSMSEQPVLLMSAIGG